MEPKQRYTLGRKDKLKSTKVIEQLFKEGKSFGVFPLRVLYLETPVSSNLTDCKLPETGAQDPARASGQRVAFSVSKKYFKKATDRNRVKRLMREAWRLQQNSLKDKTAGKQLYIFLIYTGNELPAYELLFKKMTAVIKKLITICDEAAIAHT